MFIDKVEVTVNGGKGGDGIVSFGKMAHSGPDGGNGGKGGDVYLVTESDLTLLNQFSRKKIFTALSGDPGGKNKRTGKNGNDIEIKLPLGTSVIDKNTGQTLFELSEIGERKLICTGGAGGRGNYEFRSPTRTTPTFAKPGLRGETKELILDLKLIADYGLIGLPNAGKSSLLNELTKAKAGVANYPFTTLSPNLGVFEKKIIADIPGLIEGASAGKGLGISFLKHIEKVKVFLHCISSDSVNPLKDYKTVKTELEKYNKDILQKTEYILLTKSDLVDEKTLNSTIKALKKYSKTIVPISVYDYDSIEHLKKLIS